MKIDASIFTIKKVIQLTNWSILCDEFWDIYLLKLEIFILH